MRYADGPAAEVDTYIEATPETVWDLVTDIELMARLSSELQAAQWVGDEPGPAPGREFVGRNHHQAMGEWETRSFVVECERPSVFAWAVSDAEHPSATWRFTLRPEGAGTRLSQWVRMGPARSGLSLAIDRMPEKEERIVERRLGEFRAAMEANLAQFKEIGEGTGR
jgi:uncharacterized protein YndB with AHSA1/START domain